MRNGAATKARIETEALRLFVEKGVAETTTRDIAAAAGVREGTIYVHFRSKDALVQELFRRNYAAYGERLQALAATDGPLRERLDRIVRSFCGLFDESPLMFRFLLLVQHEQLDRVDPEGVNLVDVLRAAVADGMAAGEIRRGDPELAAAMVLGIVLQTATFKVYGRIRRDFRDMADDLSSACWRVLS